MQNIHGWEKSGFLEYIGWYNDENLWDYLQDAISKLMPCKEGLIHRDRGRNYVDGRGCRRIISVINAK